MSDSMKELDSTKSNENDAAASESGGPPTPRWTYKGFLLRELTRGEVMSIANAEIDKELVEGRCLGWAIVRWPAKYSYAASDWMQLPNKLAMNLVQEVFAKAGLAESSAEPADEKEELQNLPKTPIE